MLCTDRQSINASTHLISPFQSFSEQGYSEWVWSFLSGSSSLMMVVKHILGFFKCIHSRSSKFVDFFCAFQCYVGGGRVVLWVVTESCIGHAQLRRSLTDFNSSVRLRFGLVARGPIPTFFDFIPCWAPVMHQWTWVIMWYHTIVAYLRQCRLRIIVPLERNEEKSNKLTS